MGMHADGSGVEDGVEAEFAERGARDGFAIDETSEGAGGGFATCANENVSASGVERDGSGTSGATGAEDEDATAAKAHFTSEGVLNAEVIGVAAVQGAIFADGDGVDGADFFGERFAGIETAEDGFLVGESDAEAADAEFGNSGEEVAELLHEEWEEDGVAMSCAVSSVVEQRRKRVGDGIADDAVDGGARSELVRTIERDEFRERDLAGSGGGGNGGISEGTAGTQSEDACGQADFAHGNSDDIARASESEESKTIGKRAGHGGDFEGLEFTMARDVEEFGKRRSGAEIVNGKHHFARDGARGDGTGRKFANGFDFEIAPVAAGIGGFDEPEELGSGITGKFAATDAATAGGEEGDGGKTVAFEPGQEFLAFRIGLQPVETKLDGTCEAKGATERRDERRGQGGGRNAADAAKARGKGAERGHDRSNVLKTKLVACLCKSVKPDLRFH